MDGMTEKQIQRILDFLLNALLWVIGINLGIMIVYSGLYLILQVAAGSSEAIWDFLDQASEVFPTVQRILGIISLPVAIFMAYLNLKRQRRGDILPDSAITSEDVPDNGEISRQTKQRLIMVLSNLMRVIGIMLAIVITLELMKVITERFEIGFTAGSIVILVIGVVLIAGLAILVRKISKE